MRVYPYLRPNQNGFRPGRSTTAHILALRGLIKAVKEKNLKATLAVTHPERFSYWYTGMGAQVLVPKLLNIPLFTLLFCIAGYVSSF